MNVAFTMTMNSLSPVQLVNFETNARYR